MRISVSPISGAFSQADVLRYYAEISNSSAVDRIYAGELFCPKRDIFDRRLLDKIRETLTVKGKQLVISTPVYHPDQEQFKHILRLSRMVDEVEINNLGFLAYFLKHSPKKKLSLGPFFPLGDRNDLEYLLSLPGFKPERVTFRYDMTETAERRFIDEFPETDFEIPVYGHIPLAYGWDCAFAEALKKNRQGCGFLCSGAEPVTFDSLKTGPSFIVDGNAVLSGKVFFTLKKKEAYAVENIAALRISPLMEAAGKTVRVFDDYAAGNLTDKQVKKGLFSLSKAKLRTRPLVTR